MDREEIARTINSVRFHQDERAVYEQADAKKLPVFRGYNGLQIVLIANSSPPSRLNSLFLADTRYCLILCSDPELAERELAT
jgi:hypothetical protein